MRRLAFATLLGPQGHRSIPLTRREILQAGLATTSGLLSGLGSELTSAAEPTVRRRMLVVGAGFAGLACAFELKLLGYDVRVFEARSRVGGRVHTLGDFVRGKNVEAGAELIGSNHPTWLAYAAAFGLKFLDVSDASGGEQAPVMLGGRLLAADEVAALNDEVEKAQAALNELAAVVNADSPWKSPNAERLDLISIGTWIDQQKMSGLAKQMFHAQLTGDNAVSSHQQSLLGILALIKGGGLKKYWTDSEVYRCDGGSQQLADCLVESIGTERVALNCAVRSITQCGENVFVEDACGGRHEADDVVLAVPPSVWNKIQFEPTLPSQLHVQMGTAVKYLAEVDGRYWKANGLYADASTDGDISSVWEGTDNQLGGDTAPAVLVAFSGGPGAAAVHARQEDERRLRYHTDMEALFPGFEKRFRQELFIDWLAEPWTMAGYSFPAPGEVTKMGPLLREGVDRLHFAGEHTCYQFVGFMEGALRSGVDVAKRIAIRDGLLK